MINPDPLIALLNTCPRDFTQAEFRLLLKVTMASKQKIAKSWKSDSISTIETKNRVTQAMNQAKIEAIVMDKVLKYTKIGQPWVDHFLPPHFDSSLLLP